jgi:hypothetical protein
MRDVTRDGEGRVEVLAQRLSDDIRKGVPVVTSPLALAAMFQLKVPASFAEIAAEMDTLRAMLPDTAADYALHSDQPDALQRELDILALRAIVVREGESYHIGDRDLAAYYANSLKQHFSADAAKAIPEISPNGDTEET